MESSTLFAYHLPSPALGMALICLTIMFFSIENKQNRCQSGPPACFIVLSPDIIGKAKKIGGKRPSDGATKNGASHPHAVTCPMTLVCGPTIGRITDESIHRDEAGSEAMALTASNLPAKPSG
jgi:hypothetical protein